MQVVYKYYPIWYQGLECPWVFCRGSWDRSSVIPRADCISNVLFLPREDKHRGDYIFFSYLTCLINILFHILNS